MLPSLRPDCIIPATVRSPIRWILLAALGLGGAYFAWRGFPRAFSILALDLRMDRAAAVAVAESLAVEHDLGPREDVRTAVVFDLDAQAQTYIELEGGGPEAFKRAVAEGIFHAYTWQVRRVAPEEVNESWIAFTPAGRPLDFREQIAEEAPGPALSRDSARALAESRAREDWGVALDEYALLDASEVRHTTGRVDHSFTYEAREQPFGEGRLRLGLEVTGDRLTRVNHYLHVPEAFSRRYQEIRAANEAITQAAVGAMLVLYGIGGVGVGLILMLRRRMIIWRPALVAGLVFGGLQLAAFLNAWPFFWLGYQTTVPVGTFIAAALGLAVLAAVGTVFQVGISVMAAETLSRAAFPRHPQFWRLWSAEGGASRAVLGQTVIGYLLIGAFLGYMVAFWRYTTGTFGWWNPTETLVQPNLFATYLPWLGPAALALNAGFWEESLFRAVPLAGAALLGDRYGRRGLWIGAALVVQALIFSAAHANYPAQPPYARLVELIIPSLLFAVVYLRFGLLPGIILHAGYDLALMAIPMFAAESPNIWFDRSMILAVALVPAAVVIGRRLQAGGWTELPEELRNGAWTPPPAEPPVVTREHRRLAPLQLKWLMPVGAVGLAAWLWFSDWSGPPVELDVFRDRAIALAREDVEERGGDLSADWRALADAGGSGGSLLGDESHQFVWETAGDSAYWGLLGDALRGPHWLVRFARFEGDVAERAEEWIGRIGPEAHQRELEHRLPEGRPGATLDEAAARALADSVLTAWVDENGGEFELVGIRSEQRPARTDWFVTYADPSVELPQGEVRAEVEILGDEVNGPNRFVFVPESWQRAQMRTTLTRGIPALVFGVGFFILFVVVLVASVIRAARGKGDRRVALILLAGLVPLSLLGFASEWPTLLAGFETSRPWDLQIGLGIAWGVLGAVLLPAIFISIVAAWLTRKVVWRAEIGRSWIPAGLLLAGAAAVLSAFRGGPPSLDPGPIDTRWPLVTLMVQEPMSYMTRLAMLLVPFWVGDRAARRGPGLEMGWYFLAGGALGVMLSGAMQPAGQLAAFGLGGAVLLMLVRIVRSAGIGVFVTAVLLWHVVGGMPRAWGNGLLGVLGYALGMGMTLLLVRLAWRESGSGGA